MANLTPISTASSTSRTRNLKSKSANGGGISDDNIKVYVRVRPPDSYANEIDHKPCLEVTSRTSLTLFSKPDPKVFTYDQVADPNTTQEEVFTYVAKKIIDGCLEGYNGTIFAYGQTGSGKTFTMLGPVEQDSFNHELRGVIPRGFEYLFNLINREKEKLGDKVEFLCQCSFLEIYNEQIFDLLDPTSTGLQLREDIKRGVFVDGMLEKPVSSARDVYDVLNSGWLNRRVASTSMNRESSRSHAVFTITIESKEVKGTINNIKVSRLHLVDLAGSERQKDTQTEGLRLKEAGSINKSLSALGNVIMALVDITHGKQRHVPYRDSKLTFLLRDSLGGNARTHIIANVHPSARCFGETLSTLNFARRAKQIKNKAIVNEDTSGNVASLQEEIRKLKLLLSEARAGINTMSPSNKELSNAGDSPSLQSAPGHPGEAASQDGPDEWKKMMLTAINLKEKSEQEKQALEEKVKKLEELCKKKEKFLQSTKMILKFRDAHIAKLEKSLKKNGNAFTADERDKELEILREEIKILQEKVEHHPDVTRFAMENLELRAELRAQRSNTEAHYDLSYDLSKTRFYAMQLERKLRDSLNTPGSGDLEKSLSSSLQSLEASNAELERYKSELTQVQGHLEAVKEELHQTREDLQQSKETLVEKEDSFRKKFLESNAEIESSKKTITELQRTLETLQLKTAIERTTLNDVHMQAIRTLSSPRSFTSTPSRKRPPHPHQTPGSPHRHSTSGILDEQAPNGLPLTRRDSYHDVNEPDLEESFLKYEPGTPDDEEIYQETLLEELRQLQDMYNVVLQEKQSEEAQRIKLNQMKNKLELQVEQLNEFLSSERTRFGSVETDLNKKVIALNDQLKEGMSEITILKSENEDLKICLQQADRQIDSLKKDRDVDKINTGRKAASLESKICTLEIELSNTKGEMEEILEINQNFQTDVENMREELQFKDHKLSEWENLVIVERGKLKSLKNELESCLEKLHMVTEANEKLNTQADKQQQLIAALEQCVDLKDELQQSNALCEEQGEKIIALNKKVAERGELVSELKRQVQEEKDYRLKLLDSVKELKSTLCEKESKITSLESVIAEKKDKIEELTSDIEKRQQVISKLKERLHNENEKHEQERETLQSEILALKEEVTTTSEHCRELVRTLEEQQQQFGTLQGIT
ncbi:kinesin-like protein KIF15 isoform X2 [Dendronephthya gigantea]|uniref:kinesin-like protein KIF15 isoform X2 n=1 Tax=Dendronephthya gigantea TaxID=151771 RepID=UPI0010692459|nr:kinesin-like protein KIF15 isoform X2 [Dendronephthya gigantea]